MFSFGGGGGKGEGLKLDVQDQGDIWTRGQGGWGVLKTGQFSRTSYVYHTLSDMIQCDQCEIPTY